MNDRIGIDTHGLADPPDEPEWTDEDNAHLDDIENQIGTLIAEYKNLTGGWPVIFGYHKKGMP
jgi:hypothetical protein